VNVIAILSSENLIISPFPEHLIQNGDKLVVIGHRDDLNKFANIK
jgi:trk system potassium uptake protein TrkA